MDGVAVSGKPSLRRKLVFLRNCANFFPEFPPCRKQTIDEARLERVPNWNIRCRCSVRHWCPDREGPMRISVKRSVTLVFGALVLLLLGQRVAYADPVSINTAPLVGSPQGPFSFFAMLLEPSMAGDGDDTTMLTNFQFIGGGGPIGTAVPGSGGSGNLTSGMTLVDTDPGGFNAILQGFTPGNTLSFDLSMTVNQNTLGDQFVLTILEGNPSDGNTVPTTDPTPAEDDLVLATVVGANGTCSGGQLSGGLCIQQFSIPSTASSVPEPATLLLLGSGMIGLGWRKRRLSKQANPSK